MTADSEREGTDIMAAEYGLIQPETPPSDPQVITAITDSTRQAEINALRAELGELRILLETAEARDAMGSISRTKIRELNLSLVHIERKANDRLNSLRLEIQELTRRAINAEERAANAEKRFDSAIEKGVIAVTPKTELPPPEPETLRQLETATLTIGNLNDQLARIRKERDGLHREMLKTKGELNTARTQSMTATAELEATKLRLAQARAEIAELKKLPRAKNTPAASSDNSTAESPTESLLSLVMDHEHEFAKHPIAFEIVKLLAEPNEDGKFVMLINEIAELLDDKYKELSTKSIGRYLSNVKPILTKLGLKIIISSKSNRQTFQLIKEA